MKKLGQDEINKIIKNHLHWLKQDCNGWSKMKMNLNNIDLSGLDLSGAELRSADLINVNLSGANLNRANLKEVNLKYSNLKYANLREANLRYANLKNADLTAADLTNAYLENATISHSLACPSEGSFTAWKKVNDKIIKLQILEDSKRLSATTDKCRCDRALVLEIQDVAGNKLNIKSISSDFDTTFIYRVGEIAEVSNFDENRWNACATGIHFFIDREMAVNY